jgi:hypothetical protein
MRNNKYIQVLFTILVLISLALVSCPAEEDIISQSDPSAMTANQMLELLGTTVTGAEIKDNNIKFTLAGAGSTLPKTGKLVITGVSIDDTPVDISNVSPLSGFAPNAIKAPTGIFVAGPELTETSSMVFTLKGMASETMSDKSKEVTVPHEYLSGIAVTLNPITSVAHSLKNAEGSESINTEPVVILDGGFGTVSSDAAPGGSIAMNFGNNSVSIYLDNTLDNTKIAGSITAGSVGTDAAFAVAGSFTLGSSAVFTGLDGILAIRDAGSASSENSTAGTFIVWFGSESSNFMIKLSSLNYTVPQFGVLVTAFRDLTGGGGMRRMRMRRRMMRGMRRREVVEAN